MTDSTASSYRHPLSLPPLPPSLPVCLSACWTAEEKKSDPVSRYGKGVWSYQAQLDWKLLWKYYKTAELWVWHEKGKGEGTKVDPASKERNFQLGYFVALN